MKSKWSQDLYIKAHNFAAEAHKDQKVPGSDLPYIVHLNLVSMEIMAALSVEDGLDGDLAVQCALLHDVVEDTDTSIEDVHRAFGPEIARGVRALTKEKSLSENEQFIDSPPFLNLCLKTWFQLHYMVCEGTRGNEGSP